MQAHSSRRRIRTLGGMVAALLLLDLTALIAHPAAGDALDLSAERAEPAAMHGPTPEAGPDAAAAPTSTTTPSTTAPPTTAAPTTTVAPTTTTAPPPPTTAAPAPAPAPASVTQPAPARQESLDERVARAYADAVPAAWRADIPVRLEIIPGQTSWASGDGRISVAESHARASYSHLVDVLAHEFGHHIAFRYGTRAYPGAAPEGWPEPPSQPAEAWADCVQQSFTGRDNPSHGLPACSGAQLDWAYSYVSSGPPR